MRERKRSIPGAARDRSGSVAASAWINDADTCINYPLRTSQFQGVGKDHHEHRVDQNTPPAVPSLSSRYTSRFPWSPTVGTASNN